MVTIFKAKTNRDVLGEARGDFPGVRLPMGLVPMLPLLSGTFRLDLLSDAAGTLMAPLVLRPAAANESGLFLLDIRRISGVTALGLEEPPLSMLPRRSSW